MALLAAGLPTIAAAAGNRLVQQLIGIAANTLVWSSALAIVPLRTMDGIDSVYWITTYAVWGAAFVYVLGMALLRYRQREGPIKLFVCLAFIVAIHMLGAFSSQNSSQNSSFLESIAVFGLLAATVSVFIVSALSETNPRLMGAVLQA